jgi:hypothetical protein
MKERIIICVVTALLLGMTGYVSAETVKTISKKNDYGGKTIAVTFSPSDEEYKKDGSAKGIVYSDSNGKKVKQESFFTSESAKKDGVARSIVHYDSKGKVLKREFYDQKGRVLEQ